MNANESQDSYERSKATLSKIACCGHCLKITSHKEFMSCIFRQLSARRWKGHRMQDQQPPSKCLIEYQDSISVPGPQHQHASMQQRHALQLAKLRQSWLRPKRIQASLMMPDVLLLCLSIWTHYRPLLPRQGYTQSWRVGMKSVYLEGALNGFILTHV